MPHAKIKRTQRLDPRGPLVFDIRTLGPASARIETRTVPAPAELGAGMVRVPQGSDLDLEVQLEEAKKRSGASGSSASVSSQPRSALAFC